MFLDESPDLAERYPERVAEIAAHPASWPHYDLVLRSKDGYWQSPGIYAEHLNSGIWDKGMPPNDRGFWQNEADNHWIQGMNLQDERILPADAIFRALDMKKVFRFHYRFPLIGEPAPIGTCLDELVEIAEGLFLGQLIYSTALFTPFHSSVAPSEYRYELFGYFLLLDDEWERHRQAIGLDINQPI